ncbi:S-layer homology domain-containing protein [Paenibacillus alkalitolerans]|uniref:S-layer homology domain-containing protein n=1 Tax=Paenibacillus alkalitolerans TaxID=2799335 RepID=UPI0018F3182E|nr:S-layer homology domain-containing protein [Paenibacillus alkalitolerans]
MKKGLALLLAASMSLSAFSTAFAADDMTAQEKFDALKEKGIFEGYDDGTAGLDKDMTRAQFAMVLKRLLKLEEVKPATPTFSDVKADHWAYGAIEASVKAGYINGMGNGVFAPSANVTFEQLAKLLVEALDLEVDANATVDGNVSPTMKGYVAAAIKAGLITAQSDYKAAVKRDVLVSATYTAEAEVSKKQVAETYSVKAVGAKTIEVTFGGAVADTSKVEFAVKKGTITVNVAEVKFNDAKTVATLTLSAKLTDGEYTVTAKNAAATELSAKFTAETEKVTAIKISSDKAALDRNENNDNIAWASLTIENQYGENVTKAYESELNISSSADDEDVDADGNIKFTNDAGDEFRLGEQIVFTAVHTKTGVYAQQTFTVSQAAKVADISIVKLYNKDNKTLSVNSTPSDFKIVVEGKDQYGNAVTAKMLQEDIKVFVSNNDIFDVDYVVDGDDDSDAEFKKEDDMFVLNLARPAGETKFGAGKATVHMTSVATGKRASIDIEVIDVAKVDVLNLSAPEKAVAGKDVEIPFEAVDQFGKALTDADALNNGLTSIDVSGANLDEGDIKFVQDYVNKTAKLVLTTTNHNVGDSAKPVYVNVVTSTGKLSRVSFNLQPAAKAEVVTGLDDFGNALALQGTDKAEFKFKAGAINVLDQYGDEYAVADNLGTYKVVITKDAGDSEVTMKLGNDVNNKIVLSNKDQQVTLTPSSTGSSTIKIALAKSTDATIADDEIIDGSEKEITVNVVDRSSITGYEVGDLGKIYVSDDAYYNVDLSVKGLTSNGTKVTVPVSKEFYSVTGDVYFENGKLSAKGFKLDANSEKEVTVFVIPVTKDGVVAPIEKKIVVSNKDPEAAKFELKDGDNGVAKKSDTVLAVPAAFANANLSDANFEANIANKAVKVVDQYGKELNGKVADLFKYVIITGKPADNKPVKAGDELNVSVVAHNSKVFSFKVVVTE